MWHNFRLIVVSRISKINIVLNKQPVPVTTFDKSCLNTHYYLTAVSTDISHTITFYSVPLFTKREMSLKKFLRQ